MHSNCVCKCQSGCGKQKWWNPIIHFLTHTTIGTSIFVIIAIPAIGLGEFVKLVQTWTYVPEFTIKVLEVLEDTITVSDALLFVAYLLRTAYYAVKEEFK